MLAANSRRCLALVLTLAVPASTFVVTGPAYAQPKKKSLRDSLTGDAAAQWDNAIGFYSRGKWSEARSSFQAAYDASKNPRILFNVAVCEKNNAQYARAIETFKRELAEGKLASPPLDATEESDVKAQIAGLEKFVAALTIDVNEPGADIFVDNEKVGVSPLPAAVSVPLGERRVRATKAGFGEANETVDLKGGGTGRVAMKLTPNVKQAVVRVEVTGPTNSEVLIDGRLAGPAPYTGNVSVQAEPHQFSAQASGYITQTIPRVIVDPETPNTPNPQPVKIGLSPEQQKGKLIVTTHPDGATIEIDGKVVGATHWEGAVDTGNHQIVVKKTGFYQWNQDIEVPRGGERNITAALNEDRNNSFVPWLIGTVLVIGASATAVYFVTKPKDQDKVNGTLAPFTVGTPSLRFH